MTHPDLTVFPLKPGLYTLTRDVAHPRPDRRTKQDWRWSMPRGTEVIVHDKVRRILGDSPEKTRVVYEARASDDPCLFFSVAPREYPWQTQGM